MIKKKKTTSKEQKSFKNKLRKIWKKLRKKYKRRLNIGILSLSALLVYFVQEVIFIDSSIKIEDKTFQYQNHEIFLRDKLLTSIENMANSESFSGIRLNQERKLDQGYLTKVYEHLNNLTQIMRVLRYYNLLVSNVLGEISNIPKASLSKINSDQQERFVIDGKKLLELSSKYEKCTNKINSMKDKIIFFLSPKPEKMSVEDKTKVIIKISEFGKSLYFDECFLVTLDGKSSKSIDELIHSINNTINYYSVFLQIHQKELKNKETIKVILILLLLLFTAYSFYIIESEDNW